jgi:hypothetical protein
MQHATAIPQRTQVPVRCNGYDIAAVVIGPLSKGKGFILILALESLTLVISVPLPGNFASQVPPLERTPLALYHYSTYRALSQKHRYSAVL